MADGVRTAVEPGRSQAGGHHQDEVRDPSALDDELFLTAVVDTGNRPTAVERVEARTSALFEEHGRGLRLVEAELSASDLSGLDLRAADLTRARLASTSLDGADLSDSTLICPLIERTSLRGTNLQRFYGHAIAIVSSNAAGADLSGAIDCTGALFHGVNFSGADLSRGNFAGATFYQCQMVDTKLDGADLSGSAFNECVLYGTSMQGALLEDATVLRSQLRDVDLTEVSGPGLSITAASSCHRLVARHADLGGMRLRASSLIDPDFTRTDLEGATLDDTSATSAVFEGATLRGARLRNCVLTDASFAGADLSDATLIATSAAGASFVGARAENARLTRCTMPGATFSAASNDGGFFGRGFTARDCDLSGAAFDHAYLYRASFTGDPVTGMQLDGSTFESANLIQAYVAASLRAANLRGARAAYARLNQSDLSGSDLRGANLYEASLVKTVLAGASLRGVEAPVFFDRCPGIESADMDEELVTWTGSFQQVVATSRRGST
jgi:uncharacterized protein YjbI with pentapeptide repeats